MPQNRPGIAKINDVIRELQALPRPFVVITPPGSFSFGVGRRLAQQIMAPSITDRVGTNGLADCGLLIARLRQLANGDDGYYEVERRRKAASGKNGSSSRNFSWKPRSGSSVKSWNTCRRASVSNRVA